MLEEHLLKGGILNIDNEDEAKRVVALAQQHQDIDVTLIGPKIRIAGAQKS